MSTFVLLFYVVGVWWFCIASLKSKDKLEMSGLDWLFAIMLPLASSLGTLGFMWGGEGRGFALAYLPIFMLGLAGTIWEIRDLKDVDGGFSIPNLVVAVGILGLIFGIGLILGAIWLRRAI